MGTALAINFSKKLEVSLVLRSADEAGEISRTRRNHRYLPDVEIPANVRVTGDLPGSLEGTDLVLIAAPVSAFAGVLAGIADVRRDLPVLWACKGFCPVTCEPLSQVAAGVLGPEACYGVLSGPSFANGLAANDPTAMVVATCAGAQATLGIAEALSNSTLRVYANSDLVGVQICGAIKNVYAIAAGIIDGCGWGENTRAAMMTRAITEIRRYLDLHGADPSTLMGLSGFGDIHLTCGSRLSRNYQVGLKLAGGKSLDEVLRELGHVAEGVLTARLVRRKASQHGIEMPLASAVHDVLEGLKTPRECGAALMARDIKDEKFHASASRPPLGAE